MPLGLSALQLQRYKHRTFGSVANANHNLNDMTLSNNISNSAVQRKRGRKKKIKKSTNSIRKTHRVLGAILNKTKKRTGIGGNRAKVSKQVGRGGARKKIKKTKKIQSGGKKRKHLIKKTKQLKSKAKRILDIFK